MTATASMPANSTSTSSPSPPRPATPISPLQLKLDNILRPTLKVKTDFICSAASTVLGMLPRGSPRDEDNQHNGIDGSICTTRRESAATPAVHVCARSERSSPSSSAVLYSSPYSSVAATAAWTLSSPSSPVEDTNKSILMLAEPASESDEVGEEVERAGLLTKHAAILSEILGLHTPPASPGGNHSDDDCEEGGGVSAVCRDTEERGDGSGNGNIADKDELGNKALDDKAGIEADWLDVRMVGTDDEKEQKMNVKRRRAMRGSLPMSSEMGARKAIGLGNKSVEEKYTGEGGEALDLCACQYCPGHRKRDDEGA